MMRILLAEAFPELAHWLPQALQTARLRVECAPDGAAAERLLRTRDYALALLDPDLPCRDGLEVLKRLRARGDRTPVLILATRGSVADRVRGLNLGADDYLVKPVAPEELDARIKALLRRASYGAPAMMQCGALSFDKMSRTFRYGDQLLALTPREHGVLEALLHRQGHAVSKEKLFQHVFSLDDDARLAAIEIYIHRLRKKLTPAPAPASAGQVGITTLRGLGYLLQAH